MKGIVTSIFGLLFFATTAQAGVWVGATLPIAYDIGDRTNGVYSIDGAGSGKAQGYVLTMDLPMLPAIGYEKYQVELQGAVDSLEDPNLMHVQMYDLLFNFSGKDVLFFLGIGQGQTYFECMAASCQNVEFLGGKATQVFMDIGVPFAGSSDFHISLRKVKSKITITDGTTTDELDLSGTMMAFGIRIGF